MPVHQSAHVEAFDEAQQKKVREACKEAAERETEQADVDSDDKEKAVKRALEIHGGNRVLKWSDVR